MKRQNFSRKDQKQKRHARIFKKIKAINTDRPRLVISKTNNHLYAQIIDDQKGQTLASSSTLQLKLSGINIANAAKVGKDIAKKALDLKIKEVVFDRGGSIFHGRIQALAKAAREEGLKF